VSRALLLAAIAVAALAAAPARAEAVFPPGSKVGLSPPAGFKPSDNFRGFEEKLSGAAILTLELPAQAYGDIEKAMTAPALKKQGVIVEKREALALKSGKGVLLVGRQEADGKLMRKWILLGSTPALTALVTVLVPDSAKGTYPDAAIREALASVEVRDSVPIDEQMALLPYRVDELGGLRASRVVAPNTVVLTSGPKDTLDATEQALLVISAAPGGPDERATCSPATPASRTSTFWARTSSGLPGSRPTSSWPRPRTRKPTPTSNSCNGCGSATALICASSASRRPITGRTRFRGFGRFATG
jgi:hypothetical protein